jgi:hypothetical protein
LPETNFADNIFVGFVFKCSVAPGPKAAMGVVGLRRLDMVEETKKGEEEKAAAAPMQLIINPLITGVINKIYTCCIGT